MESYDQRRFYRVVDKYKMLNNSKYSGNAHIKRKYLNTKVSPVVRPDWCPKYATSKKFNNLVCKFFLRGSCTKTNCQFSHTNCPFRHLKSRKPEIHNAYSVNSHLSLRKSQSAELPKFCSNKPAAAIASSESTDQGAKLRADFNVESHNSSFLLLQTSKSSDSEEELEAAKEVEAADILDGIVLDTPMSFLPSFLQK